MKTFEFRTAKGSTVRFTDDGEDRYMSVGNYENLKYIKAGKDLIAYKGENKIVVPIPKNIASKFSAWEMEGEKEIDYTIECSSCGNVKNGSVGNQYCTYCDSEEYHRVI